MRVDSEVGDAVGFGVNPLIVVVALWKFGKSGRAIVDTVERHQVEIIESRREVSGRCSKHIFEIGDCITVWREDEKLGTFRVDADIACNVV